MRSLALYCGIVGSLLLADIVAANPTPMLNVSTDSPLRRERWSASWITAPGAPKNEFGVYLFRRELTLERKPEHFIVHLSGDSRYRLFVNGTSVCFGPQRSDTWVWRYETVDLAPWLRAGANCLAAEVWSYGALAPYATVGGRTGFLLQGDTAEERGAETGAGWSVMGDAAYAPLPAPELHTYMVIGPGYRFDAAKHPWGWDQPGFAARDWPPAEVLARAAPVKWGTDIDHALAPRNLPLMEETPVRFASVRRASGVTVTPEFVRGQAPLRIAAHRRATVLLDHGVETNAFPDLTLSGGAGSRVRLAYAEALFDAAGAKGNRDEVEGRQLAGLIDEFVADGAARRHHTTLNFRTYRYVELQVETADEPLQIDDLAGRFTGYPFTVASSFTSDDPSLARIWDVGWRTARLCAFETYVDCPYYEQLQYVGDTRIQALISLYVSGDDRLMRNAIELYDRSRLAEGLTQSRYPSVVPQVINTFSLFWIEMVHDYWRHRPDTEFVRAQLPGVQAVLGWFERHLDRQTGLLGPLPYWTFVDWTDQWSWSDAAGIGGEPDGARSGGSSIVSLQLAGTLRQAAALLRATGDAAAANHYDEWAARLCTAVQRTCWDEQRQLFADTPAKRSFSQHANTFAVLAGAVTGPAATELMRRTIADPSLTQASTYFRFYLLRAMKQAGLGDEYLKQLGPWRTMLALGLTTFAEKPDPTRSDCHAWSASPVYELLATVCGIEPGSPGFTTVRIEPHLGPLQQASGTVPHPAGEIRVRCQRRGEGVEATITLPPGVTGEFVWGARTASLQPGEQQVKL
jgi:hypothetical protein